MPDTAGSIVRGNEVLLMNSATANKIHVPFSVIMKGSGVYSISLNSYFVLKGPFGLVG